MVVYLLLEKYQLRNRVFVSQKQIWFKKGYSSQGPSLVQIITSNLRTLYPPSAHIFGTDRLADRRTHKKLVWDKNSKSWQALTPALGSTLKARLQLYTDIIRIGPFCS